MSVGQDQLVEVKRIAESTTEVHTNNASAERHVEGRCWNRGAETALRVLCSLRRKAGSASDTGVGGHLSLANAGIV